MDKRLIDLLVCPVCKGPLRVQRQAASSDAELICRADRLAFPVRDGLPVMLEPQARRISAEEIEALPSPTPAV